MLETLPQVIPSPEPSAGGAGPDHPLRIVTRRAAFDEAGWDEETSARVRSLFDTLAPEWNTRDSPTRLQPLSDALTRGGQIEPGRWLEGGSGSGLVTPWLSSRARTVIALDISAEMLRQAPASAGHRIRADSSRLPMKSGSLDAVVLLNALLFPVEIERVLGPTGALVWVSTSGARTPIYLSAEDVLASLRPERWHGVRSSAGAGTWAVFRRAVQPVPSRRGTSSRRSTG